MDSGLTRQVGKGPGVGQRATRAGRHGLQGGRGRRAVSRARARLFPVGLVVHPALVNGTAGIISTMTGRPFAVGGPTLANGKIMEIDILADPERLAQLDLAILEDGPSDA
jgi:hypothetical protein